jgi:hypothetical protein
MGKIGGKGIGLMKRRGRGRVEVVWRGGRLFYNSQYYFDKKESRNPDSMPNIRSTKKTSSQFKCLNYEFWDWEGDEWMKRDMIMVLGGKEVDKGRGMWGKRKGDKERTRWRGEE